MIEISSIKVVVSTSVSLALTVLDVVVEAVEVMEAVEAVEVVEVVEVVGADTETVIFCLCL